MAKIQNFPIDAEKFRYTWSYSGLVKSTMLIQQENFDRIIFTWLGDDLYFPILFLRSQNIFRIHASQLFRPIFCPDSDWFAYRSY